MNQHDLVFLKRFAGLIVGFAIFTVILILAAIALNNLKPSDGSAAVAGETIKRIQPLGGVYAGDTGRQAMLEAQEQARAAAVTRVAFEGSLDGSLIYDQVCSVCHNSGAGGSPLLVQSDWEGRIAQGFDVLLRHSIEGYEGNAGIMPARGGRPDLSDEQVAVAVRHILDNLR